MRRFHQRTLFETTYCGIPTRKNPLDMWVYQELIWKTQPDYIVEIGTYNGGSALALAHLLDQIGKGEVITLDIMTYTIPRIVYDHPRVTIIEGDATTKDIFEQVSQQVMCHNGFTTERSRVLVIEDSAHTLDNTLKVLECYSPLLSEGDYFIVEDSILGNGLSEPPDGKGPMPAIEQFLEKNPNFEQKEELESFGLTFNPRGFLQRVVSTA